MSAVLRVLALAVAASAVAVALVVAGMFTAPAARAAGQPIQFSADGIHWSDSYTGSLFDGVLLVPGGSADRAFYVRNNAGEPGKLRVTLYDVATTDINLATAMTVSTSMPGNPGAAVAVTAAQPCATLSQGQVLAAGDSARLDNVATLADLNGTVGQTRTVSFKLAISLSSTDSAAPQPNACPTDFGQTVIGSPDPGPGSSSHPVYHLGATGWTPVVGTAFGNLPAPTAPEPGTATGSGQSLVVNTERFYQEDFVAFWLAMAVLGVLLFIVVRRRRRSDDDEALEQYPYFRQPTTLTPTTQNGTGQ